MSLYNIKNYFASFIETLVPKVRRNFEIRIIFARRPWNIEIKYTTAIIIVLVF